ncbi:MAG: hypothetical protein KDB02_00030 [Acidimicrobiales bacterium]|nr:hypothetical protein [Acidimicrobiales bacterium]
MASSGSTRKVAKVASKSGSSSSKRSSNWLFPAAIVLVVALGVSIVMFARSKNSGYNGNSTPPRAQLSQSSTAFDHWHAAFAIDICGEQLPPQTDAREDALGIHTHGDGLIHIHPFSVQSAGKRATMQKFFDQVGLKVSDDRVTLPTEFNGSRTFESGVTTCGGKPAEWALAHWKTAHEAVTGKPDKIYTSNFGGVRFTEDLGAFTLAFVPKGTTDIPGPTSAKDIDVLGECDGANPPPECQQLLQQQQAAVTTVPDLSTATAPATTAASGSTATTTASGR